MKGYKNDFSIGADPELFIIDKYNRPYPAIGMVKGDKEDPHQISKEGHCVQVDNVMLEFNIPPRNNPEQTWRDIQHVMIYFNSILAPLSLKTSIQASAMFDPKHLTSDKAQEFGCDPDLDVWLERFNDPPNPETNLRTAGGHVHIGYKDADMDKSSELVKLFDLYLVIPSLLIDPDDKRREMYGKAGAFRFKDYGVECRQLSNFWISDKKYVEMIYNQVDKMFDALNSGNIIERESALAKKIVNIINNNDKQGAEKMIKEHNII